MKKITLFHTLMLMATFAQATQTSLTVIENEKQFNKIIGSNTPSVIVFTAEWCSECQVLKPSLQHVADDPEFKKIFFATIDADENQALAYKYKLPKKGIPIILFMQGGVKKHRIIGSVTETVISAAIRSLFSDSLEEKLEAIAQDLKETTIA